MWIHIIDVVLSPAVVLESDSSLYFRTRTQCKALGLGREPWRLGLANRNRLRPQNSDLDSAP